MASSEVSEMSEQVMHVSIWLFMGVICQLINIFGIVTNIINIVCYVKQGFDDSVNISLLGLAVSDLGSLITMVWTCFCVTPAVATADLPFNPIEISYLVSALPHFAFTRVSGSITAMITLERCLCITYPLKIKQIITPKRTTVAVVGLFIIFVVSGSPVYFVNSIGLTFSATRNTTIYGRVSEENCEDVEKFSFAINNFIIPLCSFAIIVVCTAVLSLKLKQSLEWRQKTIKSSHEDRVFSRNQKTAKMIVMISSLFIACFIPLTVYMLAFGLIPSLSTNGKHVNISLLIGGIAYFLEGINCSMNIFIYYHMSSKYRAGMARLFSLKTHET